MGGWEKKREKIFRKGKGKKGKRLIITKQNEM